MAAAIILIPEMLSGPKQRDTAEVTDAGDGPFKTYTIDLNRSPGLPAHIEEAAPPPETPPASPLEIESSTQSASENPSDDAQASPESGTEETQSAQVARSTEALPPARQPAPATQPTSPAPRPRETNSTATIASRAAVPTSRGWAVQLGSFSSRATAERMVKDLSGSGYDAFVMPVQSGGSTLYRVRVGPFAERAAANEALAPIKKRVANAAVVAHP